MKGKALNPWAVVGLLWLAYFLNQADRQIFNVTLPLIQKEFGFSSAEMGLVATIFTVVFGLLVPFAGYAGDRFRKSRVVVLSLLVFSAGTLLTGAATGLVMLIIFRGIATGAGEAFYSPAATSWIADKHEARKATALSIHHTANYAGVVFGSLLIGLIADRFGWRVSFAVFGAVGLVWAAVIAISARGEPIIEKPPVQESNFISEMLAAARLIAKSPLLLAQMAAFGGVIFVLSGYSTWMPTILHDEFGQSLTEAGFSAVASHHAAALLGLVAGALTDRIRPRFPRIRLIAMAGALILSAPFIWMVSTAQNLWGIYAGLTMFGFWRGIYDSNLYAAIFDEVPETMRAKVASLIISAAFILGAFAPTVMGLLEDDYGLRGAMGMLAFVSCGSGLVLLAASILTAKNNSFGGEPYDA